MKSFLPERVTFSKISAGGNDFVCIDNTRGAYADLIASDALATFVSGICRRGLSVGADGVIFACEKGSGDGIDVVARFMEPDGSEARLCGNGTACFAAWCIDQGIVEGPAVDILTAAGTAYAQRNRETPSRIRVCVPDPHSLEQDVCIDAAGRRWTLHVIDTGVPHAVVFVDELAKVDVPHWGAAIRHHPRFAPLGGVNVNFTRILAEGHIGVRTFEFGVEAETLACGTGSTAAAIVSAIRNDWQRYMEGDEAVRVDVRGDEQLRIWFKHDGHGFTDVCLETGVKPIYEGTIRPEAIEELCVRHRESTD